MKIALGCDHAALEMKSFLLTHLAAQGITAQVFPENSADTNDYPIVAEQVALAVKSGAFDFGVLLCGTGAGMAIAANKVAGVRAVNCSDPYTAKMSKEHNNANVLCMGSRAIGYELAAMVLDTWLAASFEVGGRHERRVALFAEIEERQRHG